MQDFVMSELPPDRSWMDNRSLPGGNGITGEFFHGVENFIAFAKSHLDPKDKTIRCPCQKCRNISFHGYETVMVHLLQFGFIDAYKRWKYHGEPVERTQVRKRSRFACGSSREPEPEPETEPEPEVEPEPFIDGEETYVGMEDMVRNAAGANFNWLPDQEEEPNPNARKFIRMMEAAKEKVCPGSDKSVLESTAELLNIKAKYNISQAAYNAITEHFKGVLPKDNKYVGNFYETKKMVGHIGLGYVKIDCCRKHCMLFYKENEGLHSCSVCGLDRYKPKRRGSSKRKKNVPYKQLRYMPLIPRLQRLFSSKSCSEAMRWHKESPREEGVLTHLSDGEAWKHFDATYADFASDARNIRLGVCSDGFSPFGPGASTYSCWPIIVTVYNLPPWLCMTDPYMYLSLFIPGPFNPGKSIDVYLRPLIDELKQLWTDGVETWDAFKRQNFNMKAAVMWTINDFPAYGMLSGWSTHGRLACPYCMERTKTFTLPKSSKQSWFDCHRQFLPGDHPFRRQKNAFKTNTVEHGLCPPLLSGEEIFEDVSELPSVRWGKTFRKDKIDGFGKTHNWTKKSIFWELPYWKTNLIRHNLDVMHIEKNVFENVYNTVMDLKKGSKDTVKSRMDIELICSRPHLNLQCVGGKIVKPVAPFVLNKEDKTRVLQWLKDLKLPEGCMSNLSNCVDIEAGTIHGLKSHDCHVLLDRLLPIAFRDILPDDIWVALTELSEFFRAISSSTLRVEDMKQLEKSIVVTLCKLEKIFPPSFFDSIEHLPVHLAYEARVGGPVQYRWMYPFERFLGRLKHKMSNRARVEASISESMIIDEICSFVSDYFHPNTETRLTRVGCNYDGETSNTNGKLSVFLTQGEFPKSTVRKRSLERKEYKAAKLYVLLNCPEVTEYLNMFEALAEGIPPDEVARRTDEQFPSWLEKYISDHPQDAKAAELKILLNPFISVFVHNGYDVNGYKFHTEDYGKTKSTWNSGVNLKGNIDYYGVLQEVIEFQYSRGNSVVLFNCTWLDSHQGIRKHDIFDLVDIKRNSKHVGADTFILASQAQQVYMSVYPRRRAQHKGWWGVWKTKARNTFNLPYTVKESSLDDCYQEDEMPAPPNINAEDDFILPENPPIELEDVEEEDFLTSDDEEEDGEEDEEEDEDVNEDDEENELEFCSEDDVDESGFDSDDE